MGYCSGEKGVALEFAGGDVVAGCVAADVIKSISFRDVLGVLGDDEAEFAFVVCLVVLRDFRDDDGGSVVVQACVCFNKG